MAILDDIAAAARDSLGKEFDAARSEVRVSSGPGFGDQHVRLTRQEADRAAWLAAAKAVPGGHRELAAILAEAPDLLLEERDEGGEATVLDVVRNRVRRAVADRLWDAAAEMCDAQYAGVGRDELLSTCREAAGALNALADDDQDVDPVGFETAVEAFERHGGRRSIESLHAAAAWAVADLEAYGMGSLGRAVEEVTRHAAENPAAFAATPDPRL